MKSKTIVFLSKLYPTPPALYSSDHIMTEGSECVRHKVGLPTGACVAGITRFASRERAIPLRRPRTFKRLIGAPNLAVLAYESRRSYPGFGGNFYGAGKRITLTLYPEFPPTSRSRGIIVTGRRVYVLVTHTHTHTYAHAGVRLLCCNFGYYNLISRRLFRPANRRPTGWLAGWTSSLLYFRCRVVSL